MKLTLSTFSICTVLASMSCKDAEQEAKNQQLQAQSQALIERSQRVAAVAEAQQAAELAEQQRVAAAAQAERNRLATERARLEQAPTTFLETRDVLFHDKGIINSYRQVASVTVLNKSHFAIKSAEGDVTWSDDQGRKLGSTPVVLRTSIPAGDTRRFSIDDGTLSSGTLQGEGSRAAFHFTSVDVIDTP
jgi:hypothetical protein